MNGHEASDPQVPNDPQIQIDPQVPIEKIVELGTAPRRRALHRLDAVRRTKRVSRREFAQRLGISVEELRAREESADLSLATLSHWAATLKVSVTELVIEPDECLAPTRLAPSQAARLLKLAARLRDRSRSRGIQRLAQTFVEQLAEIIPSLAELAKMTHGRRSHRQAAPVPRPLSEHVFTGRHPSDR